MSSSNDNTIRRTLFSADNVFVYAVPPAGPNGYQSAQWLARPPMAEAALTVVETAETAEDAGGQAKLSVAVVLTDPSGALFASAPYTSRAVAAPAADSARFFALRVRDPGTGRAATLGIGFAERGGAFELRAALEGAAKVLGFGPAGVPVGGPGGPGGQAGPGSRPAAATGRGPPGTRPAPAPVPTRDLSLKAGQTMTQAVPGTTAGAAAAATAASTGSDSNEGGLFTILPPPPPAPDAREESHNAGVDADADTADLDDDPDDDNDDFGDFQ